MFYDAVHHVSASIRSHLVQSFVVGAHVPTLLAGAEKSGKVLQEIRNKFRRMSSATKKAANSDFDMQLHFGQRNRNLPVGALPLLEMVEIFKLAENQIWLKLFQFVNVFGILFLSFYRIYLGVRKHFVSFG
jgi:hypothetical protein